MFNEAHKPRIKALLNLLSNLEDNMEKRGEVCDAFPFEVCSGLDCTHCPFRGDVELEDMISILEENMEV